MNNRDVANILTAAAIEHEWEFESIVVRRGDFKVSLFPKPKRGLDMAVTNMVTGETDGWNRISPHQAVTHLQHLDAKETPSE